jgi:hypothetical protein
MNLGKYDASKLLQDVNYIMRRHRKASGEVCGAAERYQSKNHKAEKSGLFRESKFLFQDIFYAPLLFRNQI